MTQDSSGDHLEPPTPFTPHARPLSGAGARLSRYLRLAKRRRTENQSSSNLGREQQQLEGVYEDAPNVPMASL